MSNALGVKRRLAATETHTDTSHPTARCPLQLLVGRTAYRCGLTQIAPRTLWSLEEVPPTVSSPLRLRGPSSAVRRGVGCVPWKPHDGPADPHQTPPGWHQAPHTPHRPLRRYRHQAAHSPGSADGGAPPRGLTPVYTRSWPQVGHRSGGVASHRAPTVGQSPHPGTSTGGCPREVRQPARASACVCWESPSHRTTRACGAGTCRSHRWSKASVDQGRRRRQGLPDSGSSSRLL
jgi:hypothetical protein